MRTSNKAIYALGDVTEMPKFTHMSGTMAGIVVDNALFGESNSWKDIVLPRVTYTEPEVAHVSSLGLQCQDEEIDVYTAKLNHNDRAILDGSNSGFVRIRCRKGTDEILSASIVHDKAGDIIPALTIAIQFGIRLGASGLGRVIHSYPTVAEGIGGCAFQYKMKHWKRLVNGEVQGGE
mmetsp:Transcript_15656/g.20612  ORF Transcript_15656/g.20612 Transcript_15656/m.20612 type:complete len:178 (-) Transcript_15656:131-664(-)